MAGTGGGPRAGRRSLAGHAAAIAAVVTAIVIGGGTGCGGTPRRPNVLLIVVDTLRADRLGCYGAERDTSPAIDAFAEGGVRFERAYSPAPWTKPAIGSIFTGLYPSTHGADAMWQTLRPDVDTLAEILSARGYRTAGVIGNALVSSRHGFDQGFETYFEEEARGGHLRLTTQGVTAKAVEQIEAFASGARPFFLFVLYFDPHYAYMQHEEIDFAAQRAGRLEGGEPHYVLRDLLDEISEAELELLRDLYDEEVRFTDAGIARLLEHVRALGLERETVVVLTADHGEEFLERGWIGHTRTLYEELIRIPLIVRAPGVEPGVVSTPVSALSLAPTILDLTGVEGPRPEFHGSSIAGLLRGDDRGATDGFVFAEVDFREEDVLKQAFTWSKDSFKTAVVGERFKLIRDDQTGAVEIYDLESDPHERRDLAASRPDLRARLAPLLLAYDRIAGAGPAQAPDLDLSDREIEALRDLGYVE